MKLNIQRSAKVQNESITPTSIFILTIFDDNNFRNKTIKIDLKSYGQNLQYHEREHKKAKKEQDLRKIPGTPGKNVILFTQLRSSFSIDKFITKKLT